MLIHMGWFSEVASLCPVKMETWFGDYFEEIRTQKNSVNVYILAMHTDVISWALVQ